LLKKRSEKKARNSSSKSFLEVGC